MLLHFGVIRRLDSIAFDLKSSAKHIVIPLFTRVLAISIKKATHSGAQGRLLRSQAKPGTGPSNCYLTHQFLATFRISEDILVEPLRDNFRTHSTQSSGSKTGGS